MKYSRVARDKFGESVCKFYDNYRLYYHMLSRMRRVQSDAVPTAGVGFTDGNIVTLFYNPEFMETLSVPQTMIVLDHECQHVGLKHITRGMQVDDKILANISMDVIVNSNIPALSDSNMSEFRKMLITADKFEELNKKQVRDLTWEEIYKLLKPKWDKQKKEAKEQFEKLIKNHSQWSSGKSEGGKEQELKDIEMSPAQRAALDDLLKESVKDLCGSSPGNVPGSLKRLVKELSRVRTNWRSVLSMFAQTVAKEDKDTTWKRYNRRLGVVAPGNRREYKPKLLVAIDNSGSIGEKEYNAFVSHVVKIAQIVGSINGIGVDTRVNFEFEFKRGAAPSYDDIGSGGGTDFQPAFDYAKVDGEYNGIIYFTDGFGDNKLETFGIPVIFAITSGGAEVNGFKNIKLDEEVDGDI